MLLEETLQKIRPLDRLIEPEAQRRLDSLTKPQGSLGKLEDLARCISVIQAKVPPRLGRKLLFVFAADHGITAEGVSAYVLARHCGVDIEVVDIGVDYEFPSPRGLRDCKVRPGTNNFTRGPAMRREETVQSIETGIRLVEEVASENLFLLGAGDMGIGNTSSAAAVLCALTGALPRDVVGRGTGIDDATWGRKVASIEKGLDINRPDPKDPLDVIAKVGGLEIGAMIGVILGAAVLRIPMVLDGFISGAAAILARRLCPSVTDVLFASHLSAEKSHVLMLEDLKLAPLLDLEMRLGEGTGACLAMGLIEAAVRILREMATFESAGVKQRIL